MQFGMHKNPTLQLQHCYCFLSVRLYFLGSKITADGACSHEIKRHLLLGRKVMTNLDSIFKSRDITLPTKVHIVKAMVFPVVIYGCESWTVNKAECRRIDAFELQCWRRLLRVPWTARRSNHSILKEISPRISWKESYDQPRQHIQKQRHYFDNKGPSHQGYGFFQWSCMDVSVGL